MALKRFLKYYLGNIVAFLLALLSILSNEIEKFNTGTGIKYYLYVCLSFLNSHKVLIGVIAIAGLILSWVVLYFIYRPRDPFIEEACRYISRNNDLAAESKMQITIYKKRGGLRTLLTYFKNIVVVLFSRRCWKAGLVWIYLFKKIPNPLRKYYVKTKQFSIQKSFWTPTLYFKETYNNEEGENGYMSYYLYNHGEKHVSVAKFRSFIPHKNKKYYEDNQKRGEYDKYISAMHLSETDFRCLNRASNFVYVAPIDNLKSEHIGAIVIDIDNNKKINITTEFKAMVEHTVKMINTAVNYIK